jgi:hypothetical protein
MNRLDHFSRLAICCCGVFVWSLATALGQDSPPQPPTSEWVKVSPEGAGFEVLMPVEPKLAVHDVRPMANRQIKVHMASATAAGGKAIFMTAYHDLDFDAKDEKKIRDVLDGGVHGSLLNALGKISKHEQIKLGEHPGRHFEYAGNRYNQKIEAVSRIYLVGRRVIQITVIRTPETDVAADITKFFDSLKLVEVTQKATTPVDPFSADSGASNNTAPKKDGGK